MIFNVFKRDCLPPPYDYDFLLNLDEKEYPKYLKELFKYHTGKNLNLKNPKTFNEKIQWLKLYDCTPIKVSLTDKVLARDYVRNKIGEKYLKPLLWVGAGFSDIPFDILPNNFIIKANNGCKWHYKIKNKEEFLKIPVLYNMIKEQFDGWMQQKFCFFSGLEMQYKYINPQILIEPVLIDKGKDYPVEIEVYCFNGRPVFIQKIEYSQPPAACIYTRSLREAKLRIRAKYKYSYTPPDENIKSAIMLSEILSKDFILVRVDWLLYKNQIYFNEMTFTPFSGYNKFPKEDADLYLGGFIELNTKGKDNKYG